MEISANDWSKLRLDAEIARRVHLAEGHLPRPRPQAPEVHAQGTYRPPKNGQSNFRPRAKPAATPEVTPVDLGDSPRRLDDDANQKPKTESESKNEN